VGVVGGILGIGFVAAFSAVVFERLSVADTDRIIDRVAADGSVGQSERERVRLAIRRRQEEIQKLKDQEAAGKAAERRPIDEQNRKAAMAIAQSRQTDNTDAAPTRVVNSEPPPTKGGPLPELKPFDRIRDHQKRNLQIPTPQSGASGWIRLADVDVNSPEDVTALEILGDETVLAAGSRLVVMPPKDDSTQREWLVQMMPPEGSLAASEIIGTFRLAGQELLFRWQSRGSNCLLVDTELKLTGRNRLGDDSVICRLRAPEYRDLLKLTEAAGSETVLLFNSRVGTTTGLRLKYSIDGLTSEHKGPASGTLTVGQPDRPQTPARITHVHNEGGVPHALPELELSLVKNSQGHLVLKVDQFLKVPRWSPEDGLTVDREDLTPQLLKSLPEKGEKFDIVKELREVERRLKVARAELAKAQETVNSIKARLGNAQKKPFDAAMARKDQPGADFELNRAKHNLKNTESFRDAVYAARDFHKTSQRWHALVATDRAEMLQNVRIRYELLRIADAEGDIPGGQTNSAPLTIVATRAEENR